MIKTAQNTAKYVNFESVTGFNDRWLIVIGLPLASVLISILLFSDVYLKEGFGFISVCIGMSFVHTAIFWFSLRWVHWRSKIRYPKFEQIGQRTILFLLAFLFVYCVLNEGLKFIFDQMTDEPDKHDPNPILTFFSSLLMSALLIISYEAISFYIQLQKAVVEKTELERQNIESQLEGLRNQVNPHFLFNSLNTLAYLIHEDSDKALRFLQKLSDVYRYVLESRDARVVPLTQELTFLNAYVYLLKERFGDNLIVEIKCHEYAQTMAIVPLSLQMLFENAIKHNVISVEKPLTISVFCENDHLIVQNNLQKKNQVMDSTGVGINNIRNRYAILTDQAVQIIPSQHFFTVALPAIKLM